MLFLHLGYFINFILRLRLWRRFEREGMDMEDEDLDDMRPADYMPGPVGATVDEAPLGYLMSCVEERFRLINTLWELLFISILAGSTSCAAACTTSTLQSLLFDADKPRGASTHWTRNTHRTDYRIALFPYFFCSKLFSRVRPDFPKFLSHFPLAFILSNK